MRLPAHQVTHVQDKIGSHACHIGTPRNLVKWAAQFGVSDDVVSNIFQSLSRTFQTAVELRFGLGLGFSQRLLLPALGFDFPLSGCLNVK